MENRDETSASSSASQTHHDILAGAAHGASLDVARRALMLMVRLFALGEQEPLVNVMIDKVPRQQFVVDILSCDVEVGIGQRSFAPLDFAVNLRQLMPDRACAVALRSLEPFKDAGDAPIAARHERLEIRVPRRLGVE